MLPRIVAFTGTAIQAIVFAAVVVLAVWITVDARSADANGVGDGMATQAGQASASGAAGAAGAAGIDENDSLRNATPATFAIGTIIVGGSFGLIGTLLSIFAATLMRFREQWFYWASAFLAVLYCIVIPLGSLLGGGFLIYLLVKRREFLTDLA